jgi:hypothetical protein
MRREEIGVEPTREAGAAEVEFPGRVSPEVVGNKQRGRQTRDEGVNEQAQCETFEGRVHGDGSTGGPLAPDGGRHIHSVGTGREIAGDDGAGSDDATVADGYATEHGDAGTEPNVVSDVGWEYDVSDGTHDLAGRRHSVIGRQDAAEHRDELIVAKGDSDVAESDGEGGEVNMLSQTTGAAEGMEDAAAFELAARTERKASAAGGRGTELSVATERGGAARADFRAGRTREHDAEPRGDTAADCEKPRG